jgi:hypothetical protein
MARRMRLGGGQEFLPGAGIVAGEMRIGGHGTVRQSGAGNCKLAGALQTQLLRA